MTHSSSAKTSAGSESHQKPDPRSAQHEQESSAQQSQTSVHPVEPEDKRAAGTSGSRQNEILQQNVGEGQAKRHPETPAGQHATGSFPTGTEKK
ncbi:MAG: hypothetical protein ACLGXA_01030 [Acidobacteriota bacterium]